MDIAKVYKTHYGRVYGICYRMLQNREDAEDLTQDVFVTVSRKWESYRGEAAFTTWLHRVTVNQVLMHIRKVKISTGRNISFDDPVQENLTAVLPAKGTARPELQIDLEKAFAAMPAGYKKHFLLYDLLGYEHAECAEVLGTSEGTSKSQHYKALQKMRRLLNKKVNPKVYIPVTVS